jgi:hypothetical protein
MVGILIKVAVGAALFVGSLLGSLAATGRLNHEGAANIPVLNSFFPVPEESEHAEGGEGAPDEHAAALARPSVLRGAAATACRCAASSGSSQRRRRRPLDPDDRPPAAPQARESR